MHLQNHCVVIFKRVFRQDEHLNSLVRDFSSLSLCHSNMHYSYSELFIPEFALPISTSSFLAVTSQRSSVTTYDTWEKLGTVTSQLLMSSLSVCQKLPHGHLLLFYLLHLRRHFSTE